MKKEKCSNRIKEALTKKNMKASELSSITGISKSMISEYIHDKYIPKQNNLFLIANALEVSPSWLMGYDVPMHDTSSLTEIPTWYSWKMLTNNQTHNNVIELIQKISDKYPKDFDIACLISILSSYLQNIDNISINKSIIENSNAITEEENNILSLFFELNDDGKELVSDYIEMIHSKSEYVDDDVFLIHDDKKKRFYFFFKNLEKNDDENE